MFLLIFSTVASFIGVFIPQFIKPMISYLYKESSQEISLKYDISELEKQLAGFSMVDEFAKCARLQRKIVQLKDELNNRANLRRAETMKKKIILSYAARAIMGIVVLVVIWQYRKEPVVVLPDYLLWPLSSVLSWPSGIKGAVSVTSWLFISGTVAAKLAANLNT